MKKNSISQIVCKWLLLCVVIAFCISTAISYMIYTQQAKDDAEQMLKTTVETGIAGMTEEEEAWFYSVAKLSIGDNLNANSELCSNPDSLNLLLRLYCVSSRAYLSCAYVADSSGIIIASLIPDCIGFDMASTPETSKYLGLLNIKEGEENVAYQSNMRAIGPSGQEEWTYLGIPLQANGGFVLVGFSNENIDRRRRETFTETCHYSSGEYLIGQDMRIISAPIHLFDTTAMQLGLDTAKMKSANFELFESIIGGVPSVCMSLYHERVYYVSSLPTSEVYASRETAVWHSSLSVLCVFCLFFVMVLWLLRSKVTRNIDKMNGSLAIITGGQLEEKVDVHGSKEFDSLSADINSTVDRLKQFIHEAETRMDADLAMGKSIQLASLPSVFPAYPERKEFDVYAGMTAAKEVGGDFYDFFFVNEHQLVFLIADVSGKGIPAALFMMRCKAALKDNASTERPLDEVCMDVNNSLCEGNETNTFFTAWVGIIDLRTGLVTYINAGHNAPLYRQTDGTFAYLDCQPNIPMAVFPDFEYQVQTLQLHPGDEIFLYTDGVTEATNVRNELYGDDRLLHTFNSMTLQVAASPESIYRHILKDVQDFAAGAEQSDDITMLCLRYEGLK